MQRSLTEREKALMVVTGAVVAIFIVYLLVDNQKKFAHTILDGITLAAEYFMVASGFTLVFGLMRQVNLAHGSLYLLGAYVGWSAADATGSWYLGVAAGFLSMAVAGVLLQLVIFRRMEGQDLRQTLVTIGLSIVLADLMKWQWGAEIYQLTSPTWLVGFTELPFVRVYQVVRLAVLGIAIVIGLGLWLFLNRTTVGMMIRAGVDDRAMLACSGVNVQLVFAITFAIGAGLAGFAGVIGGTALSFSPGDDTYYLLASLVVVIVGGMGSVSGVAVGALLVGLADRLGLAYTPTYGVVYTFLIMVAVLAFRPQGIMGRPA